MDLPARYWTTTQLPARFRRWVSLAVAGSCLGCVAAFAQEPQVHIAAPMTTLRDSYYEHYGIHWGFYRRGPGGYVFFDNGGWGGARPPWGGFVPGSGAHFGFGQRGRDSGYYFNFSAAQGSQRSIVSTTPSLTVMNGGTGYLFHGTWTPFVTGLVPVVSAAPWTPAPVQVPPRWAPPVSELAPPQPAEELPAPATRPPARREDFVDPPLVLKKGEP